MQPPSDRSNKNPYAMPSAWPRAPEQTFHLRVPKAPPGMAQAAKPAPAPKPAPPPRPARTSSILSGSALPVGYTAPQPPPDVDLAPEPFVQPVVEPVVQPVAEPIAEPVAERAGEVTPAPPFVAPPETPFAAPLHTAKRRPRSRAPLFIGAALAATAGIAAAAWLLMREPQTSTVLEPATSAPARAPVIVPPSLDYVMSEEEAAAIEPTLRGEAETAEPSPAPVTRVAPSEPAVALPSAPTPYSGSATPVTPPPAPVIVQPRPAPPPPASAPGPTPPVADPDTPQTTRDPTSGN